MTDQKIVQWNDSYARKENYIFYPHEELVKFLNRHIRKRIGIAEYRDLLQTQHPPLRALDFGCGIGAGVRLLQDFGIDGYGVDISTVAIQQAQAHGRVQGLDIEGRFLVIRPNSPLPSKDREFDFFISYGVLDSMPFAAAKQNMREIARVTKTCGYISLMAGDYREFYGEEEVKGAHEFDTIQSYFDFAKCEELIADTGFRIKSCELVSREVCDRSGKRDKKGRYHLVLYKP